MPAVPAETPSGYPGPLDRPRLAARIIWGGPGAPWESGGLLAQAGALALDTAAGPAVSDLPAAVFGLGIPVLAPPAAAQ